MNKKTNTVVIFGPDGLSLKDAMPRIAAISPYIRGVKIHDLYDKEGPGIVKLIKSAGIKFVWVDAKILDTPKTAGLRTKAIVAAGADRISAHIQGGQEMLQEMLKNAGNATICGITVLSSLTEAEVEQTFVRHAKDASLYWACQGKFAGLKEMVCAPQEVKFLRGYPELNDVNLVVPGTRFSGSALGDQKRSLEPLETLLAGADELVMVSDLLVDNPVEVLKKFQLAIDEAPELEGAEK